MLFKEPEVPFEAQAIKLNTYFDTIEQPERLLLFVSLGNPNLENGHRVSIFAATIAKIDNYLIIQHCSSSDVYVDKVINFSVSSVVCQCHGRQDAYTNSA